MDKIYLENATLHHLTIYTLYRRSDQVRSILIDRYGALSPQSECGVHALMVISELVDVPQRVRAFAKQAGESYWHNNQTKVKLPKDAIALIRAISETVEQGDKPEQLLKQGQELEKLATNEALKVGFQQAKALAETGLTTVYDADFIHKAGGFNDDNQSQKESQKRKCKRAKKVAVADLGGAVGGAVKGIFSGEGAGAVLEESIKGALTESAKSTLKIILDGKPKPADALCNPCPGQDPIPDEWPPLLA